MSPSAEPDQYAQGWSDLMRLVRQGYSWSGGEGNRFFLNGGGSGGFHEMSGLGGLDHADDGRGVAVVDWDQDGRLDLWYRNRTAPRLRVMLNRREMGESVAIRLEGVEANRDGIGAVVELLPGAGGKRLVRSVRAGELFLSQSSKWLHFGIDGVEVDAAEVLWPGGVRERFTGVTGGARLVLKQGTGRAVAWKGSVVRAESVLEGMGKPLARGRDDGRARILLPSRIPLPRLTYRDQVARPTELKRDGKPRLLLLWSGDCPHCEKQLKALAKAAPSIRAAQLEVLALSVEGTGDVVADSSEAYELIDAAAFPFPWGLIDDASLKNIQWLQSALFDRTPASAVPLAILTDQGGNAMAIYRGPFEVGQVIEDWNLLRHADEKALYHLAPPMAGTWFTNPLGRAEVIRLIRLRGGN